MEKFCTETCSKFISFITDNHTCIFDTWNQDFVLFSILYFGITCILNILTVIIIKLGMAMKKSTIEPTGTTGNNYLLTYTN